MRSTVVVMGLGAALAGCPTDEPFGPANRDSGVAPGEGIELHGQVVDFESCPVGDGCDALAGMVVEVLGSSLQSEPSAQDGAFLIEGAPAGTALTLAVRGTAADGGAHARTILAGSVGPSDRDVYGITMYAMGRRTEYALLEAIMDQEGIDLEGSGGYVGQVVARIDPEVDCRADPDDPTCEICPDLEAGLCAVRDATARISLPGYGTIEYARGLPSFLADQPNQEVIDDDAPVTNVSGMFVVLPSTPSIGDLSIEIAREGMTFLALDASVEPGGVTFGFHRAE
ncbi:MAG: hypothetical protein HYY06_04590 [Deltaproteobacteria bacterium]|nr:hypothetical protein [Deltaproteobacteria bacterium]